MEFGQRLQDLRKQKGLTQEELANALYVSRAAVSKWESGRGYPNIDSLKAIARFYSVTVDELLSGGEALAIAEAEQKRVEKRSRERIFALLDMGCVLLFVLPLFGQRAENVVQAVPLLSLTGIAPYLRLAYVAVALGLTAMGVANLLIKAECWEKYKATLSLLLSAAGTLLFIRCRQTYAATLLFVFLAIKVFMLIKKP